MRIVLVNRYYGGHQVPTGRMLQDLGEELSRRGHEVEVLTSASTYSPAETAPQYCTGRRLLVRRMWTAGSGRLVNWILFWIQVSLRLPWTRGDRFVLLTDPPFMIVAAWFARLLGRQRSVYWWTMDLYPEALVAAKWLRPGGLCHRFWSLTNEVGLRSTAGVICLGERQRQRLAEYSNFRTTAPFCCVVPPWDRRSIPKVERASNRFLMWHGWKHKRLALYAGNLGEAHCFGGLVDAAREMVSRGNSDWMFVFVVRGRGKSALEAQSRNVPNVTVLDYQPSEWTADVLWAADVHLITMNEGWDGVVVPSKLYGALQTDAPILFVGPIEADTAKEVLAYQAGTVLPVDSLGSQVIASLEELSSRPRIMRSPAHDGPARIADFICGQ